MSINKTLVLIDASISAVGILLLSILQLLINYGIVSGFLEIILLIVFLGYLLFTFWFSFIKKDFPIYRSNIIIAILILIIPTFFYSLPFYSFHNRMGVNNSIFLGVIFGGVSRASIYLSKIYRSECESERNKIGNKTKTKKYISNGAFVFGLFAFIFYILASIINIFTQSLDASVGIESLGLYNLWNHS